MRTLGSWILLAVLASILFAAAASAQPGIASDPASELDRTDRILERAREQVGVSTSASAGGLLDKAFEQQHRARSGYRHGDRATWRATYALTMEARSLARRALETAEIEVKAHASIDDLIESTRTLAQEAVVVVAEGGDPEAKRLLDGGLWQLQRAQDANRAGEYRKAIRLATTARDLVQRAIQSARGGTSSSAGAVEIAIERTQALIEEVRMSLEDSGDVRAKKLLEEAVRLQANAIQMQKEQRFGAAMRLTTQARQAAFEAMLLVSARPEKEDVERALSVVDQLIQDASAMIAGSGSTEAAALLSSARQRAGEAREQFVKGNTQQALATARIAEGLLRRAAELAGSR